MRAVVLRQHGGPETLEYETEFPRPEVVPGEAVIAVRACSLNYHDVFTRRGMPGIKVPFPMVMGLDIAGEIAELGPGVTGWSVGDRVLINPLKPGKGLMGEMVPGGLAEYCLASAAQLIRIPDGVSFADAAALPVAYGTAYRMLFTNGGIKAGDKIVVLGASGGVGTGCVLLAKQHGCEVIACGSSETKLRRLTELGADRVIDYTKDDFVKAVQAWYGKPQRRTYDGGVDMVVNFTGGDTWVPSMKCLKRGGKLMTCGATAGFDPKTDLRYIWSFELKILGSNSWAVSDLEALLALVQSGRLKPVVDRVFPLTEAREALRLIEDREVFGKVIVAP